MEKIDLEHLYIDGAKLEARANKYTFVWRKGTEKQRYKVFEKVTGLLELMNSELQYERLKLTTNTEYDPEYLEEIYESYLGHYLPARIRI